jgi:hypothetical protein
MHRSRTLIRQAATPFPLRTICSYSI